ncbi:MAG TPA: M20/M25/M40 family metallo-hydrolase [Streptosporangiaceae bacterium]|nr:M20/M25/M40 family metallo-hydrolase [Streptosporangiaceae bacterium]
MDADSFLEVARELLCVHSTADRPADLAKALDFVIDYVGPGFTVERFESNGKPSALLYHGAERPHFQVIFNGHVDVVPGPDDMFRPRLDGDRLYARGAHDMKVSALVLALVFRELAPALPYPLGLQIVTDEENGGRDGTLCQLEQGVTGDFVIIGEQSGLEIVTDSKGIALVNLHATGRAAHGAYPWLGDNALVKLHKTIDRILAAHPVATREEWRTLVGLARIETPNQARNQIPDSAQAWLDVRFPPEDENLNGRSEQEVAGYFARFCEPGVTVEVERADPPHHASQDGAEVLRLRDAIRRQGFAGGFLLKHGSADGRFFYRRGIDAVIFGIGGGGLHSDDEYADITTIAPYYRALRDFLGSGK